MKYESSILKRLVDTYGVIGNPRYLSEIIKQFIVRGKELYPQLFTYQSDWLAHIDEFGLTPEYTVSYTGQHIYAPNTKEKPVKRAILRGQTLVNLFKNKIDYRDTYKFTYVEEDDKIQATFKSGYTNGWIGFSFNNNIPFEIGKTYTAINEFYSCDDKLKSFDLVIGNKSFTNPQPVIGINKLKITIPSDYVKGTNLMYYSVDNINTGTTTFSSNLLILEGDYTQEDIPYFEGMQSVKMPVLTTTGKNLFDGELVKNKYYNSSTGELVTGNNNLASVNPIRVNPNTSIVLSTSANLANNNHYICEYASDGTFIKRTNSSKITTSETTYFIKFHFAYETINESPNVQLEEGSTATPYEPFKSNILTVNEVVTLRSNGSVCDELDLLTGKLTQRIDENGEILTQEVVKTVDLTIHDKDHQKVERLTTFEGGTHFTTSSQEGSLLPTLTVDVVTDLEDTLMVCSIEGNTV